MIEAVFISDLHLHPEEKKIQERFDSFIAWAQDSVKSVYILGDFFHAWAGDDSIDVWSQGIAQQLLALSLNNIAIYYLPGNRDFLLGKRFAELAGWIVLPEPTLIDFGKDRVMLVHGDRYCTKDRAHQRFRFLTRNRLFSPIFLSLPLPFRQRMVNKVRTISAEMPLKSAEEMDVVPASVLSHMKGFQVHTLIHGHTHKPGLTSYQEGGEEFRRFVLSDWDDSPVILCYDNSKGFYFNRTH